jgi:hypothetical protein
LRSIDRCAPTRHQAKTFGEARAGNARPHKALYLPALTAIRFDPLLGGFFERLISAGKSRMAVVGACMRKLLMIAYGVLKNRVPFDPSWGRKLPT